MALHAVVMAAGEGKRLMTTRAKVLHEAGGHALLDHVLAAVSPLVTGRTVVVVGHLRDQVIAHLAGRGLGICVQDPPRGTGDAVMQALPHLPHDGEVLVVSGDTPLLTGASLEGLAALRRAHAAAVAVATAELSEAGAYGRILRGPGGDVTGIVEARDATPAQLARREVNAGSYACDLARLRPLLAELRPDNAQGEYYLTDVIGLAVARGWRVVGHLLADPNEMAGVNTRAQLAEVHRLLADRVIRRFQTEGVTVLDPPSTWIEAGCAIGRDTVIEPGVHLRRGCNVGARCLIGAHSVLDAATIADDQVVPPLTRA